MGLRYMLYIFLLLIFMNVHVSSFGMRFRSQRRYESSGKVCYYRTFFCCDDFENVDGICKGILRNECSPGLTSRNGVTCYLCPRWTYGYKCLSGCHCKENQRCHNVYGCTDIYSTKDVTTKLTLTTEPSVSTLGMKTTHSMNRCLGMMKKDIFIYSLFGVGTFIIICFSIGCFCVLKKSHKANIDPNSEADLTIGVNNRIYEVDNTVERSQHVSRERATDNEYIAML